MSSRFLITGGAGFIGSHLVERLLKDGHQVRVLDNFSTGKRENLAPFMEHLELHEEDLRHPEAVQRACKGMEYVLHQGALGSVPRSIQDPMTTHDVNTTGTLNVLLAARDAGVRRVVYASSSSVYGDTPTLPKHEDMPTHPLSPYAMSKLGAEQYCRIFTRCYGLETVSLRYFNVFGPRQDPESQYAAVIPRFVAALGEGRPPVIHGDGLQTRDFTFVANNVEANLRAATTQGVEGQVFNIACGHRYSLVELYQEISRLMGIDLTAEHVPTRAGDVKHSMASIEKAHDLLGYVPKVEFYEGLRRTVEWFRESAPARV